MGWLKEWLPLIVFAYTVLKDFITARKAKKKKPKKQKRRPRQGKRRK